MTFPASLHSAARFSVREICYSGLFAAVIAIMAQISIPMPGGVPMTMQTFAITLAAVVLGAKLSTVSSVIYLLLGAVGVPVLANFSGGFDKFIGPTGGFLISFPLMAFIIGWGADHRHAFRGAYVHRADRRHDCQLCCRHGDVLRTHEQLDRRRRDRMRAAVHPDRCHQGCSCNRDRLSRSQAHPGAKGMIRLRPHHLLCTQGYSGRGYSTEFVQNMSAIVHSLRNVPGTRIRLVFGSDSLCAHCPHHTADDLCEAQEKVSHFDRKTVEYFGLHEGEYVYQDLIRAIDAQMTPAMLEDICRGCAWYPVSACKKNICGK